MPRAGCGLGAGWSSQSRETPFRPWACWPISTCTPTSPRSCSVRAARCRLGSSLHDEAEKKRWAVDDDDDGRPRLPPPSTHADSLAPSPLPPMPTHAYTTPPFPSPARRQDPLPEHCGQRGRRERAHHRRRRGHGVDHLAVPGQPSGRGHRPGVRAFLDVDLPQPRWRCSSAMLLLGDACD